MDSPQLQEINCFLSRYRKYTNGWSRFRTERFKSSFRAMRTSMTHIKALSNQLNMLYAPKFNIYHLLGISHYEVGTHSALLGDLLDPEGSHAQRHLFLESFLGMCSSKLQGFPVSAGSVANSSWFVEKEKVTHFGNLDLVISNPDLMYLLVIENKIWAVERADQLKRYSDWMVTQEKFYTDRVLIYLTPTGKKSETNCGCQYFPLSYHQDIKNWLASVVGEIKASRVKEAIVQYLEVIGSL